MDKMHIQITVENNKVRDRIGNEIHNQLVGNPDYIDNGIVLNIDTDKQVNLYIDECKGEVPKIMI